MRALPQYGARALPAACVGPRLPDCDSSVPRVGNSYEIEYSSKFEIEYTVHVYSLQTWTPLFPLRAILQAMVDGSLDRATLARLMAAMTALRAFRSQHVSSVSNESRVVVRDLVAFGPTCRQNLCRRGVSVSTRC